MTKALKAFKYQGFSKNIRPPLRFWTFWDLQPLPISIMPFALINHDCAISKYLVYQPVFIINLSAPLSGKISFQRFGVPNASVPASDNIMYKAVDFFQDPFIFCLPGNIIFEAVTGKANTVSLLPFPPAPLMFLLPHRRVLPAQWTRSTGPY